MSDAYVDRLRAELTAVRGAIAEVIANGTSVSIQGSHSYTMADLPSLLSRETKLQRDLAAALGVAERRSVGVRYA